MAVALRDDLESGGSPLESFDGVLARIRELGGYAQGSGGQYLIQCPHPDHPDRNPSASLTRGADGKALIHCHTCPESNQRAWINQVLARLQDGEMFVPARPRSSRGGDGAAAGKGSIVATYNYATTTGTPVRKHRYVTDSGQKTFEWERAYGDGWATGFGNAIRAENIHLYRQDELPDVGRVLWVEGEADADRAHELGQPAVTTGFGAKGALPRNLDCLRGLTVVIVADRDAAGLAYARKVRDTITPIAAAVWTAIGLVEEKGSDLSDHLDAGHDLEELQAEAEGWVLAVNPDGLVCLVPQMGEGPGESAEGDGPDGEPVDPWIGNPFELPQDDPTNVHQQGEDGAEHVRHEVGDDADDPDLGPTQPAIEEAVFNTTPQLAHIRDLARARVISPWALLGATLTRAAAHTGPHVRIPAFVGSEGSLNLIAALTGPSGAGKTASAAVAAELLPTPTLSDLIEANPSSGEGLLALYLETQRGTTTQVRSRALSSIDEIGALAAQTQRKGNTLDGTIRSAWSGALLSTYGADTTRQRRLPAHSYRWAATIGVQTSTAHHLLDDGGAGTAQRILWLPAVDRHMPNHTTPEPSHNPLHGWRPPVTSSNTHITYPNEVAEYVTSHARARVQGRQDALDGHLILTRLKVAAALAILHGTTTVTDQLWEVSHWIIVMSNRTRQHLIDHAATQRAEASRARGIAEAASTEAAENATLERAVITLAKKTHQQPGISRKDLRRSLGGNRMNWFDPALDLAIQRGLIEQEDYEYQPGRTATRYNPGKVRP